MQTLERSHFFSAIYIIEYLAPEDPKTGASLYNDTVSVAARRRGIDAGFYSVDNRDEFFKALDAIEEDCRKNTRGPILHLETHGTVEGITRSQSRADLIKWGELKPALIRLNVLSRMNLLVTLAACYGVELVRTLLPTEPSPVWALLGPSTQVLPSDIRNGFAAFYGDLIANQNLNGALDALRKADTSYPETWQIRPAEFFFAYVWGYYLETEGARENRPRRIDGIISKRRAKGSLSDAEERWLRRKAADVLDKVDDTFAEYKTKFLMLDRFEENRSRFPITMKEAAELYKELVRILERRKEE